MALASTSSTLGCGKQTLKFLGGEDGKGKLFGEGL